MNKLPKGTDYTVIIVRGAPGGYVSHILEPGKGSPAGYDWDFVVIVNNRTGEIQIIKIGPNGIDITLGSGNKIKPVWHINRAFSVKPRGVVSEKDGNWKDVFDSIPITMLPPSVRERHPDFIGPRR